MDEHNAVLQQIIQEKPYYGVLEFRKLCHVIRKETRERGLNKIPNKVIQDFVDRRNNIYGKKYRPKVFFRIASQSYTWQVDLMHHENRIFFVAIEINSRFAFVRALEKKHTGAFKEWIPFVLELFDFKKPVYKIMGDHQFMAPKKMLPICQERHVKLHTYVSRDMHQFHGNKLAYVDRCIRTLKWYDTKLRSSTQPERTNIVNRINNIVQVYNNSPHSFLAKYVKSDAHDDEEERKRHLSPSDVIDDIDLLTEIHADNVIHNGKMKRSLMQVYNIGDRVRIVTPKDETKIRRKEDVMLSREIFKISGVYSTGYMLTNVSDPHDVRPKLGSRVQKYFKPHELRHATSNDLVVNNEQEERQQPNHRRREQRARKQRTPPRENRRQTRAYAEGGIVLTSLKQGSNVAVMFYVDMKLKEFTGTIIKVYDIKTDNDGHYRETDIFFQDGEYYVKFKLFQDLFKQNIQSGWRKLPGDVRITQDLLSKINKRNERGLRSQKEAIIEISENKRIKLLLRVGRKLVWYVGTITKIYDDYTVTDIDSVRYVDVKMGDANDDMTFKKIPLRNSYLRRNDVEHAWEVLDEEIGNASGEGSSSDESSQV